MRIYLNIKIKWQLYGTQMFKEANIKTINNNFLVLHILLILYFYHQHLIQNYDVTSNNLGISC